MKQSITIIALFLFSSFTWAQNKSNNELAAISDRSTSNYSKPSEVSTAINHILSFNLLEFTAHFNEENKIHVKWSSINEIENAFFTVEISSDDINYKTIDMIEGTTDSSMILEYMDDVAPLKYGINYLRIKKIETGGNAEVIKTIPVIPAEFYNVSTEINYATSNNKEITFSIIKPYLGFYQVDVMDAQGNYYDTQTIQIDSEYEEFNYRMFLNNSLEKGNYQIKISSEYSQEILDFLVKE